MAFESRINRAFCFSKACEHITSPAKLIDSNVKRLGHAEQTFNSFFTMKTRSLLARTPQKSDDVGALRERLIDKNFPADRFRNDPSVASVPAAGDHRNFSPLGAGANRDRKSYGKTMVTAIGLGVTAAALMRQRSEDVRLKFVTGMRPKP